MTPKETEAEHIKESLDHVRDLEKFLKGKIINIPLNNKIIKRLIKSKRLDQNSKDFPKKLTILLEKIILNSTHFNSDTLREWYVEQINKVLQSSGD